MKIETDVGCAWSVFSPNQHETMRTGPDISNLLQPMGFMEWTQNFHQKSDSLGSGIKPIIEPYGTVAARLWAALDRRKNEISVEKNSLMKSGDDMQFDHHKVPKSWSCDALKSSYLTFRTQKSIKKLMFLWSECRRKWTKFAGKMWWIWMFHAGGCNVNFILGLMAFASLLVSYSYVSWQSKLLI